MAAIAEDIRELSWRMGEGGEVTEAVAREVFSGGLRKDPGAENIAFWLYSGGKNAFLQDANSLVMKPHEVAEVIDHLKARFPGIDRITTYARSATVARMGPEDLASLKEAGLTRVHIGMESGSDEVLAFMKKGTTADQHIRGGRNVVEAGLELSEYVMPGLGGERWTKEHSADTARVINAINPDFIRLRSLHVHRIMPLWEDVESGRFTLLGDDDIAVEIRRFIDKLSGIGSKIVSDHILNLFEEVEGKLPDDREALLAVIDRYLALPEDERILYILARRAGVVRGTGDLTDPHIRSRAQRIRERLAITDMKDAAVKVRQLMDGFI
jgi:hypothetical protein